MYIMYTLCMDTISSKRWFTDKPSLKWKKKGRRTRNGVEEEWIEWVTH